MRSVVTGVAGFVGSSIADALLAAGQEVLGIDCFIDYYPRYLKEKNLERARDFDNFTFVEGNLVGLDLPRHFEGADYIFHQAAQAGVRASWGRDFSIYTENNITASQYLLEAAKVDSVRKTLKKIVYASSSSVYGDAESYPTSETTLPRPLSPYGVSKLAAEHLMVLYQREYGVPTVSLRYFTVYGPRQRPDMAFHKFIRAALTEEALHIYGDGNQTRDFTFIDDAVKANLNAAKNPCPELVYNIGGGSRVSVLEVLATIAELTGREPKVDCLDRQRGDVKHTAADITLAKRDFDYHPSVPLKEGLARELAWLEKLLS